MRLACGATTWRSLATLAGKAGEADRLALEAHLGSCPRCADDHALLTLVRRLREAEREELGAAAHERIRAGVLAAELRPAPPARRLVWPVAVGAALALGAAALVLGPWRSHAPDGSALAGGASRAATGDVVVTEKVGEATTFSTEHGGRVRLDDVSLELGRGTEVSWQRTERALRLRRGGLTVARAPDAAGRVQVWAASFRVELAGARFAMDERTVHVDSGSVTIVPAVGATTALGSGQSWTLGAAGAPETRPVGAAPTNAATPVPSAAPALPAAIGRLAAKHTATDETTARDGLGRARQALAHGDAAGARRLVEPLFRLDRPIAAEARVLFAESFLVEGRYADAMDAYRIVTRDFPRTSQSESALFAVAQLESEQGRTADAVAGFQRYLERYPSGRFAKEASERLARLAPGRPSGR